MDQRGYFESGAERSPDLHSEIPTFSPGRATAWSRIASSVGAGAGVIPTQRECTSAS